MKKHKKSIGIVCAALAAAVLLSVPASGWFSALVRSFPIKASVQTSYFEGGDGSSGAPFQIAHPLQLYYFTWLQNLGYFNKDNQQVYFEITADLDMTGFVLPPAGTAKNPFIGILNGNSHRISNLTVDSGQALKDVPQDGATDPQIVGFFGVVGNYGGTAAGTAMIQNLNLNKAIIRTTKPKDNKAVIGVAAGYVNGILSGVTVDDSKVVIGSGIKALDTLQTEGSDKVNGYSDYGLVGYCTPFARTSMDIESVDLAVPAAQAVTRLQIPVGKDWGGSIPMRDIYNRLSGIHDLSKAQEYTYTAIYELPGKGLWGDPSKFILRHRFERNSPFSVWQSEQAGSFCFSPYLDASDRNKYLYLSGYQPENYGMKRYLMWKEDRPGFLISAPADPADENKARNYLSINAELNGIVNERDPAKATRWISEGGNIFVVDNYGLKHYLTGYRKLAITTIPPHATMWHTGSGGNVAAATDTVIGDSQYPYDMVFHEGKWAMGLRAGQTLPPEEKKYWSISSEGPGSTLYYMNANISETDKTTGTVSADKNSLRTYWVWENVQMSVGDSKTVISTTVGGTEYYLDDNLKLTDNYFGAADWTVASSTQRPDGGFSGIYRTSTGLYVNLRVTGDQAVFELASSLENNTPIIVTPLTHPNPDKPLVDVPPTKLNVEKLPEPVVSWERMLDSDNHGKVPGEENFNAGTVHTYFPLAADSQAPFAVSGSNTGYVVSGANDTSTSGPIQSGDIRISGYDMVNSTETDPLANSLGGDGKPYSPNDVLVLTKSHQGCQEKGTGPYQYRVIAGGNVSAGGTVTLNGKQFTAVSPADLGLSKYETSKATVDGVLHGAERIFGLHFMKSTISKSHTITAPYVEMHGLPGGTRDSIYRNFQMPEDCIDFTIQDRGYINFFAGSYYPNNKAFFSLNQIIRDTAGNRNIKEIKPILAIYQRNGEEFKNDPYIYKYGRNHYSVSKLPGVNKVNDAWVKNNCTMLFDTAWLTAPADFVNNALYYFEIPVDKGEFALGSASSTNDGAYLIYLDISASAAAIHRTETTEISRTVTATFQYPTGVSLARGEGSTRVIRPASGHLPDAGAEYRFYREYETTAYVQKDGAPLYSGKDYILQDEQGAWAIKPQKTVTVTEKVITWTDHNTSDETTSVKVSTITDTSIDGAPPTRKTRYVERGPDGKVTMDVDTLPNGVDGKSPIELGTPMISYHYGRSKGVTILQSRALKMKPVPNERFPALHAPAADVKDLLTHYELKLSATSKVPNAPKFTLYLDRITDPFLTLGKTTMNGKPFTAGDTQILTPAQAG